MYAAEVQKSAVMNESLGTGIAVFQGMSNVVLNCEYWCIFIDSPAVISGTRSVKYFSSSSGIVLGTIFAGGSLMVRNDMSPGDLMSFLVTSQTVQRWECMFFLHIMWKKQTFSVYNVIESLLSFYRSLASISILFGQVSRWHFQAFCYFIYSMSSMYCICLSQMVRGMSAGARVFEYLTLEPTVPLTGGGRIPLKSLTGRVDFMNISFR